MSISASPPPYTTHPFTSRHRRRSSSRTHNQHSISKHSISSPIAAHPSRQSSTSSISSSYSRHSPTTPPPNLSALATHILTTLYNTHTPSTLTPYIHPSATFTSEHPPSPSSTTTTSSHHATRASYISHWEQTLLNHPSFRAIIGECIVDESQGKVWVMSDVVTDAEGLRRRQVVDMLTFDGEGRLVEGNGFFRRMSRREDE